MDPEGEGVDEEIRPVPRVVVRTSVSLCFRNSSKTGEKKTVGGTSRSEDSGQSSRNCRN